jgi:hypothetical protein
MSYNKLEVNQHFERTGHLQLQYWKVCQAVEVLSQNLPTWIEECYVNKVASGSAKNQPEHLPNTSLEYYCYTNHIGEMGTAVISAALINAVSASNTTLS